MQAKSIVCVVTGTRAEFGLLCPIMDELNKSSDTELQLVVTGSHLCEALGNTVDEIERSGLLIAKKIDILKSNHNPATAEAISRTISMFFDFWSKHRPDIVVLLGDRYEIFGAATAAATLDIPIAHIGGGDTTEGAKDEFFRHSITKMSAMHFAICEKSKQRIIQLGEQPSCVYNTGSSGAQNILNIPPISLDEISVDVGLDMTKPFLLCTLHPETLGDIGPKESAKILLAAIKQSKLPTLFTAANADEGGAEINSEIATFCKEHKSCVLVQSLGVRRYLSAMRYCSAVVGNSSSAVIETPTLKKPAVNVGERQRGRETGENNIDAPWNSELIFSAIKKATSPEFLAGIKDMKSPYGEGNTSSEIVSVIRDNLSRGISLKKKFYDVDFKY